VANVFLTQAIGSLLHHLLTRSTTPSSERAAEAAAWITDVTQPPVGMRIVTELGEAYTGIAYLRQNEVILLLALRENLPRAPVRGSDAASNFAHSDTN